MKKMINKRTIPVVLIVLLVAGILMGAQIQENTRLKNLEKENYAYKDLTGMHSPFLMDRDSEEYIIDKSIEETRDVYPEGVAGYDDRENPLGEIDTTNLNRLDTKEVEFYKLGKGIFDYLRLTDDEWNTEAQIGKFEENEYINSNIELLKTGAERLIKGSFTWDYRKDNNREDFLAFRVGEYEFDGRITSVDIIYDRIMQKARNARIISSVEYNAEDIRVYINPLVGGFVVECPIVVTVSENGRESVYKMDYIPNLGFKTPKERDVWSLWSSAQDGVQMVSTDYIRGIEKIK